MPACRVRTCRAACRRCFSDWGLPSILRTDKGTCFLATWPQTGFPSQFTLWLVGLGVAHETITKGQVTQNGCVERFNRTYSNLVLRDGPFADLEELEQVSAVTVNFLNHTYPSRAGICASQAPLLAHPHAAAPHLPYRKEQEKSLFSLERIDATCSGSAGNAALTRSAKSLWETATMAWAANTKDACSTAHSIPKTAASLS